MPAQSKGQLPLAEIDRPQNVGNPQAGWASDAIAQLPVTPQRLKRILDKAEAHRLRSTLS